ncbi:MAG TPA: hypothetical protein VL221_02090 [Bacteroidota bacterium]|nr:hypothetical protein [Bacteroidota bacterium]
MKRIAHILALAAGAAVLLSCIPGRLFAQSTSRASQTVTFAVIPVHTPATALPASGRSDKVTVGAVGSSATAVAATRPAAVPPHGPNVSGRTRPRQKGNVIVTVTE